MGRLPVSGYAGIGAGMTKQDERPEVRILIVGPVLEGTERVYRGPSEREALLTAATDWFCCGHFGSVSEAFENIRENGLYDVF